MHTSPQISLTGTWKLISVEARYVDGHVVYPWGRYPVGYLIYTEDGYMSVVIMDALRTPFSAPDILGGTVEEQAQAARTYLSYCGSYEILEDRVIHHIKACLFPNWVGQQQYRFIDELNEEYLVLRTPPLLAAGHASVGYLNWRRA